MYTIEELKQHRITAIVAQCNAGALYWSSRPEALQKICNGVGPEYFPEKIRDIITRIFRNIAPAADIHDCRYEESDGTEKSRHEADLEFLDNSLKILNHQYGTLKWLNPAWYWNKRKAYLAYEALTEWGGKAWQKAYEKRKESSK